MRPRVVLPWVATIAVAVAAYFAYPYAAIHYVKRGIVAAEDAAAETEALCRANRWVHSGLTPTYGVEPRDRDGQEIRLWQDGRFEDIAQIKITWSTGQSVDRVLLGRDALGCVFGE